MKTIIHYSIEAICTVIVVTAVSACLIARYLIPIRVSWFALYIKAQNNNPKIRSLDDFWADKLPNMPQDIRLWYVIQDLRDEFNYTNNPKTYKEIKLLEKILKKTPYFNS